MLFHFLLDPIRNYNSGSGSRQKFLIHADADPQHWLKAFFFIGAGAGVGDGAGEKNTRSRSKMDWLRNTAFGILAPS